MVEAEALTSIVFKEEKEYEKMHKAEKSVSSMRIENKQARNEIGKNNDEVNDVKKQISTLMNDLDKFSDGLSKVTELKEINRKLKV